jgi:hypothetical protein
VTRRLLAFVALGLLFSCSGKPSTSNDSESSDLEADRAKIKVTTTPSVLHLTPGTKSKYTISATGHGGQADLSFSNPPYGVTEDTSVFLKLGGSTDVALWTEDDAPPQDRAQTITASVFNGSRFVDYHASIRLIVDPGHAHDGGAPDAGGGGGFVISANPSTIVLHPGEVTSFKISATGHGGNATLEPGNSPYGVNEETTIFLPLGGSVSVKAWADDDAPTEDTTQSFSASFFDGSAFVEAKTSVHFIVRPRD